MIYDAGITVWSFCCLISDRNACCLRNGGIRCHLPDRGSGVAWNCSFPENVHINGFLLFDGGPVLYARWNIDGEKRNHEDPRQLGKKPGRTHDRRYW